jgi:hypothetical protein
MKKTRYYSPKRSRTILDEELKAVVYRYLDAHRACQRRLANFTRVSPTVSVTEPELVFGVDLLIKAGQLAKTYKEYLNLCENLEASPRQINSLDDGVKQILPRELFRLARIKKRKTDAGTPVTQKITQSHQQLETKKGDNQNG